MNATRREFLKSAAAVGLISPACQALAETNGQLGLTSRNGKRYLRVAAVQMTIQHGDVDANLETAQRLVRKAIRDGATWIVLPEFFTTGYGLGTNPAFLDAHRPRDGKVSDFLMALAKESGGAVGGSFLAQRDGDTYNTFALALADGRVFCHDKDAPSTGHEASNYIGGSDKGICSLTDVGLDVGLALCWEMVRVRTARRLRNEVDIVLTGSNYHDGAILDALGPDFRTENALILKEKPGNLGRLVGAPVVLANPVGCFTIPSSRDPLKMLDLEYMGHSRIVDAAGQTIAVLEKGSGEDVLVADVAVGRVEPLDELQDRFWIPDVPTAYKEIFEEDTLKGAKIYRDVVRKHRNGM